MAQWPNLRHYWFEITFDPSTPGYPALGIRFPTGFSTTVVAVTGHGSGTNSFELENHLTRDGPDADTECLTASECDAPSIPCLS